MKHTNNLEYAASPTFLFTHRGPLTSCQPKRCICRFDALLPGGRLQQCDQGSGVAGGRAYKKVNKYQSFKFNSNGLTVKRIQYLFQGLGLVNLSTAVYTHAVSQLSRAPLTKVYSVLL